MPILCVAQVYPCTLDALKLLVGAPASSGGHLLPGFQSSGCSAGMTTLTHRLRGGPSLGGVGGAPGAPAVGSTLGLRGWYIVARRVVSFQ